VGRAGRLRARGRLTGRGQLDTRAAVWVLAWVTIVSVSRGVSEGSPLGLELARRREPVWRATFPLGPLGVGVAMRVSEPFGLALSISRRRAAARMGFSHQPRG